MLVSSQASLVSERLSPPPAPRRWGIERRTFSLRGGTTTPRMVSTSNSALAVFAPRPHIPHGLTPLRTTNRTTNATMPAEADRRAETGQGALAGRPARFETTARGEAGCPACELPGTFIARRCRSRHHQIVPSVRHAWTRRSQRRRTPPAAVLDRYHQGLTLGTPTNPRASVASLWQRPSARDLPSTCPSRGLSESSW